MNNKPASWRDEIRVHSAADEYPMMGDDELDKLAEDIAKNGVQRPIEWITGPNGWELLDGRNRVAAVARIADPKRREEIQIWLRDHSIVHLAGVADPVAYVASANLHRRHLTPEQKRERIARLLKEDPARSDRAIAKEARVSPTTVGKARADATVQRGQSQQPEKRVGADGKARRQPARKPARKPPTRMVAAYVGTLSQEETAAGWHGKRGEAAEVAPSAGGAEPGTRPAGPHETPPARGAFETIVALIVETHRYVGGGGMFNLLDEADVMAADFPLSAKQLTELAVWLTDAGKVLRRIETARKSVTVDRPRLQ
jgi:hypothetical protein